ncbi:uncharacterized protein Hap1MRO34_018080 isoform 2-T2 [Clarias gariepinus]
MAELVVSQKKSQQPTRVKEKRRIKEEEENVRRKTEEERLKLAQHKRTVLRKQWLMDPTPSSAEDPKLQSAILTSQTNSEREMKKEVDQTKNMDKETSQIGENEPLIHSADNIEKPVEAYLEEEKRNVLEVLEVEVKRDLLSQASHEHTEEKREVKTEEPAVHHLAVALPHLSLQPNVTPNKADEYLAGRKTELMMPEGGIEVEEDEWEMVNCGPEEGLDLTQTHTDSSFGHEGDAAVLKVAEVLILDEEEELDFGESMVLNIVVAKKSDLEDTSCESQSERSTEQTTSDVALKTLSFEEGPHDDTIAVPLQELPNVSGIISEEPLVVVDLVGSKLNLPHRTDNTEHTVDKDISATRIVKAECNEASGPKYKCEVVEYFSSDRKKEKSPALLQRAMTGQNVKQESETNMLMSPSVTPNRAETVTSKKKSKTCLCCTVL